MKFSYTKKIRFYFIRDLF